ncbi:MAG: hypothetical protein IBX56_15705 [Methylomicrobium sp.]|nr:hypothetical protein [Methylomicrobium sp.]
MTELIEEPNSWMSLSTEIFERVSDPIDQSIRFLVRAISADFGRKFTSFFTNEQAIRDYKRRLRKLFERYDAELVFEAYERFLDGRPQWPPTNVDLLGSADDVIAERKQRAKNTAEVSGRLALPKPTRQCDPVKMLADAKGKIDDEKRTREEWLKAKVEKLQMHNAYLAAHSSEFVTRFGDTMTNGCAFPGCYHIGAISSGTGGSSNWYCKEHFRSA